jgi:hypothetical protein
VLPEGGLLFLDGGATFVSGGLALPEGGVLFLKGAEMMVFRHNGRIETREGTRIE